MNMLVQPSFFPCTPSKISGAGTLLAGGRYMCDSHSRVRNTAPSLKSPIGNLASTLIFPFL